MKNPPDLPLLPPTPPAPIHFELPEDPDVEPDLGALPSRPGVFALEDRHGGTLLLSVTADLRRRVRARLTTPAPDAPPTRRSNDRAVTRVVRAMTVGSSFEADWAYLQLARRHLPETYRSLLDRWRGWFIHCDPHAPFPRFVRTSSPRDSGGVYLGPLADKHGAQRAIELIEDLFDLCRYHHILIEAPRGTACAYKEMGKCPAPCDGSISMEDYRRAIAEAVGLLSGPIESGISAIETRMHEASAALDFEGAARERRRAESARGLAAPRFRFVDRLDRFRYLAVLPGESAGYARLMLIAGGWIAPWVDVPLDLSAEACEVVVHSLSEQPGAVAAVMTDEFVQNIGLVCWHLFRAKRVAAQGEFIPIGHGLDAATLAAALTRLASAGAANDVPERE